jgi:hypothetical protein
MVDIAQLTTTMHNLTSQVVSDYGLLINNRVGLSGGYMALHESSSTFQHLHSLLDIQYTTLDHDQKQSRVSPD